MCVDILIEHNVICHRDGHWICDGCVELTVASYTMGSVPIGQTTVKIKTYAWLFLAVIKCQQRALKSQIDAAEKKKKESILLFNSLSDEHCVTVSRYKK